ncbi:MAG: hypothetical protein AB1757_12250 [Acidobacteriota bacterium]
MNEALEYLFLTFTEQPFSQDTPGKEHTPYLQIRINPKRMAVSGVDVMRANGNISASSSMDNQFAIRNGNLLEGRFVYEGSYNVACKVLIEADPDAPVTARDGTSLPAGGGAIAKAYFDSKKQMDMSSVNPREMIYFTNPRVIRGFQQGNRATLTIQDRDVIYTIRMILDGGKWKPASEKLTDLVVR